METTGNEHLTENPEIETTIEVVEDVEKQNDEQISQLISSILHEEADFDSFVENASLQELSILMEYIAKLDDIKSNISKVASIKRTFDSRCEKAIKEKTEDGAEKEIIEKHSSRFAIALGKFNKRRSEFEIEAEKEKEKNSNRKKELLEELKEIVREEKLDEIEKVRSIQKEWKEIGQVLQTDVEDFYISFKTFLDNFYKLRESYHDLIDQDRAYNLDEKLKLIEEIKALTPPEGESRDGKFWREASEKVKQLQEEWKIIGPVPQEKKDDIKNIFKDVTDAFYAARKKYYEELDKVRAEFTQIKQELIQKLEPYKEFSGEDAEAWSKATDEVKEIQELWKNTGPATSGEDGKLWKAFREACNAFFNAKAEFFKSVDDERDEIFQKKVKLCEDAEAIMDSDDWKETAEKLKELQNSWKEVSNINHKEYFKLFRRFRRACDHFFKRRSDFFDNLKATEKANLQAKNNIIERLDQISSEEHPEEFMDEIRDLQDEWKNIGHVPISEKEKIWKKYQEVLNKIFTNKKVKNYSYSTHTKSKNGGNQKNNNNKSVNYKGNDNDDLRKLKNKISRLGEEIETFETNIMFFSQGKGADKMKKDIQDKIDQAKKAKLELEAKLKLLIEGPKEEVIVETKTDEPVIDSEKTETVDENTEKNKDDE